MSIHALIFRAAARHNDNKRDKGLAAPDDVLRFDDIPYGPDRRRNMLDIYRPKAGSGTLPVIVSVHGGGWVYGDKELYQYYCMSLAQHGFAVVNFTYRLAPRHKFPAALEDTNAVFHWIAENADSYGLDTGHVFAVGDSAGAQILGLFTCLCTNRAYADAMKIEPPEGFVPTAIALNCGIYHLAKSDKRDFASGLMAAVLPGKGTPEELARVSVLNNISAGFPPCYIMTCEGDFLAGEAPPLAEKLKSLGVPVVYRRYGDENNVLYHVFHCDMRSKAGAQCNRDECDFFRQYL